MKEITLKVLENKLRFVLELLKHLGIEFSQDDYTILEEHKEIVRERIQNTRKEELLDWDDIKMISMVFKVNPQAKINIQDQIHFYNCRCFQQFHPIPVPFKN